VGALARRQAHSADFGGLSQEVEQSWLVSPEGQTAITDYTKGGQKRFHPESDLKPLNVLLA
jgi:hypothetical protein